MNGYEIFGRAVANGIYILASAFLGFIICSIFTSNSMGGADLDRFSDCAWIGGYIVCVAMVLYYGYC